LTSPNGGAWLKTSWVSNRFIASSPVVAARHHATWTNISSLNYIGDNDGAVAAPSYRISNKASVKPCARQARASRLQSCGVSSMGGKVAGIALFNARQHLSVIHCLLFWYTPASRQFRP
jgi:hypothetical protein